MHACCRYSARGVQHAPGTRAERWGCICWDHAAAVGSQLDGPARAGHWRYMDHCRRVLASHSLFRQSTCRPPWVSEPATSSAHRQAAAGHPNGSTTHASIVHIIMPMMLLFCANDTSPWPWNSLIPLEEPADNVLQAPQQQQPLAASHIHNSLQLHNTGSLFTTSHPPPLHIAAPSPSIPIVLAQPPCYASFSTPPPPPVYVLPQERCC